MASPANDIPQGVAAPQAPGARRRWRVGGGEVAWSSIYEQFVAGGGWHQDEFVVHRFREGVRWRRVLSSFLPSGPSRILDVGAGNGAVELAFAAAGELWPTSVDLLWNEDARRLHRDVGIGLHRTVGNAATLPFRSTSFDAVVCLETLEHVGSPGAAGEEISRVTRNGGVILIITPPRWRYVLRPDPHFGIRGLVALPSALQRWIAARRGFNGPDHYVERIYSSTRQIARLFPGCDIEAVLSRSRAPRRWFWDAIVLRRRDRAGS